MRVCSLTQYIHPQFVLALVSVSMFYNFDSDAGIRGRIGIIASPIRALVKLSAGEQLERYYQYVRRNSIEGIFKFVCVLIYVCV